VKVESHREFWKCHANLLECGKCNLEFSCVPSFVPAGSSIVARRLSLLIDPKVTKYGPTPVSRRIRKLAGFLRCQPFLGNDVHLTRFVGHYQQ